METPMNTIYRKVSTKERLPKATDVYYTDLGKTPFFDDEKKLELNNTPALWWMEKIELPSNEQIERSSCPDLETEKKGWKRGLKYMIDSLKTKII